MTFAVDPGETAVFFLVIILLLLPLAWPAFRRLRTPATRCPYCQLKIPETATVCGHCGREVA